MPIISASLPQELLEQIDSLTEKHSFSGRSDFLREATKELAQSLSQEDSLEGPVEGLLIVSHDHKDDAISTLRHDYEDVIKTHLHHHVKHSCVEVFMISGSAQKVKALLADARNKQQLSVRLIIP